MSGIVLDASAFVYAYLEEGEAPAALRERVVSAPVHAPHLIVAEVGSVTRRLHLTKGLGAARGLLLLERVGDVVGTLYSHAPLTRLAWSLRHNVSFYDALYVALATGLGLPLLTADRRLVDAPGLPCVVELVSPPPQAPGEARPS